VAATAPDPLTILRRNREEAARIANVVGPSHLKKTLQRAQQELNQRLIQAQGLSGPGKDSFTATQLKLTMQQIEHTLKGLTSGIGDTLTNQAHIAADAAASGTHAFLQASEEKFHGIGARLPLKEAMMFDRAHSGAQASILRRMVATPEPGIAALHAKKGILQRYGLNVVEDFEDRLKLGMIQGQPWSDVRSDLIAKSPFLQGAPAHWAERIVRTESMGAYNRAGWESIRAANDVLDDMVKILCATFDDRTGWDSYQVHGQIRRPNEAFQWAGGLYQHPPNRPNDREIVVPHRISWAIPPSLKWRDDSEVHARWTADGNKGSPPPRPKMTTVPLDQFGKAPSITATTASPEQPQAPLLSDVEPPTVIPEPEPVPAAEPVYAAPEPVAEPAIEPEPVPEMERHEVILGKLIGEQAGSNQGGMYLGTDGVKRYVKFYANPEQAMLEDLTNRIYNDLNVGASSSELFKLPTGKLAYASEIVEGKKLSSANSPEVAKKLMDGFAADVLVMNWDAVGMGLDNVVVTPGGKPVRIDTGGSLLYRAQGTPKPTHLLENPTEWEHFFSPGNKDYAGVAKLAGYTSAEQITGLDNQIRDIVKLKKKYGTWKEYISENAPELNAESSAKVASMLEKRTKFLFEKHLAMQEAKLEVAAVEKAVAAAPPPPLPTSATSDEKAAALKAAKAKASREYRARKKAGGVVQPERPKVIFESLPTAQLPGNAHGSILKPMGLDQDRAWYEQATHAKMESLKHNELDAFRKIVSYSGSSYGPIRDSVRLSKDEWKKKHERYGSGSYTFESAKKAHETIIKAFERIDAEVASGKNTPLASQHEAKVTDIFRGIGHLPREAFDGIINLPEFQTEAVTSTSWNPSVAKGFGVEGKANDKFGQTITDKYGNSQDGYAVIFRFKLNPKTASNRIAIETHSGTDQAEREIVLRPGIRYRVLKVEKLTTPDNRQRTAYMTLEEVPPDQM
jgi:hypothetical protein